MCHSANCIILGTYFDFEGRNYGIPTLALQKRLNHFEKEIAALFNFIEVHCYEKEEQKTLLSAPNN